MTWVKLGSLMMFLGVLLGAFGAHALRGKLSAQDQEIYRTGVFYHLIHALALFVVSWLTQVTGQDSKLALAGLLFMIGITLFSGSLYLLSAAGMKWLGPVTPLGGFAFMAGWLVIFFSIRS